MNGPAWTRAEDDRLMALVNARHPYREIAAQLGRTFPAVAMRVCRLRHGRPVDKARRGWAAPIVLRLPVVISAADAHGRDSWEAVLARLKQDVARAARSHRNRALASRRVRDHFDAHARVPW